MPTKITLFFHSRTFTKQIAKDDFPSSEPQSKSKKEDTQTFQQVLINKVNRNANTLFKVSKKEEKALPAPSLPLPLEEQHDKREIEIISLKTVHAPELHSDLLP